MRLGVVRLSALSFLRRFAAAQDGVVAVILALALLPALMMVGAAVDLRRISVERAHLQSVADSAALAGADARRRGARFEDTQAAATNYIKATFPGDQSSPVRSGDQSGSGGQSGSGEPTTGGNQSKVTFLAENRGDGSFLVRMWVKVPTIIMKMFVRDRSYGYMVESVATYQVLDNIKPIEVALALDTTGSMGLEGRMQALQRAANMLVDKVSTLPDGSIDTNARFGVVPFNITVNVGLRYRNADWLIGAQDRLREKLCTPARSGTETYRDCLESHVGTRTPITCLDAREQPYTCGYNAAPTICDRWDTVDKTRNYDFPEQCSYTDYIWRGCVAPPIPSGLSILDLSRDFPAAAMMNIECAPPLLRLTTDLSSVHAAINALTPEKETSIHPGLLWGYRVISPNPPFSDGGPLATTNKAVVLMTDGENTLEYPGDYGVNKICWALREAQIPVYIVGFKLPNDTIKDLLRSCPADPANYYDADDDQALYRAFEKIAGRVRGQASPLRLSK